MSYRRRHMGMPGRHRGMWSIGEVASSCGVTVRTLRHYDRLGLVVPSARTATGRRQYSERDVRRLYRVLVLRRLGLGLRAIAEWLETDSETDLLGLLRRHLDSIEDQMRRYEQLRNRLARVVSVVERAGDGPTSGDLIAVLELMGMYDDHLTPVQLAKLDQDRGELGFHGVDPWRADADAAVSALRAAYEGGAEPTDPHVQDVVRQIRELRRQFAGSDHAVSHALRGVHEDSQWDGIRAVVPQDPELRAFWKRARDAACA
jgi:MerR family transcriptional regulator, thiopeptide resistance regulator